MADPSMSFYLPNDYVSPFISANYSSTPTSAEQYFTSPATPQFYTPSQVANQVWNSGGYWSQISNTPDLMNSTKAYANNLANTFAYGVQAGDMASAQAAYTQLKNIAANPYSYRDSTLPTSPTSFGMTPFNTPGALPDSELGLLAEYGNDVSGLYGSTYSGSNYSGDNRQSTYDAWLASEKEKYNTAKNTPSGKDLPIELAKPSMPNGAPNAGDIMAEELFKLYGLDGRYDVSDKPSLSEYNPLKSDWKGKANLEGLMKGLFEGLMGGRSSKVDPAKQFESPQYGLLAKSNVNPQEAADPQRNSSNPWQSKNLIKPASYFDDSSQGIAPPKGLMGQDMITQNNVLPALQMALMNNQGMPEGNEALDAATKPLSDAKDKGNATDKIEEARNKWKSDSLNKFGNWQSLA